MVYECICRMRTIMISFMRPVASFDGMLMAETANEWRLTAKAERFSQPRHILSWPPSPPSSSLREETGHRKHRSNTHKSKASKEKDQAKAKSPDSTRSMALVEASEPRRPDTTRYTWARLYRVTVLCDSKTLSSN